MTVDEPAFNATFSCVLNEMSKFVDINQFNFVVGPGRSGAVASVYASHHLGIPFLPWGASPPAGSKILVVDTAMQSGRTIRRAMRKYNTDYFVVAYQEPPRVKFWYEGIK